MGVKMLTILCLLVIIFTPKVFSMLVKPLYKFLPDKKHGGGIAPMTEFIFCILSIVVEIRAILILVQLYFG